MSFNPLEIGISELANIQLAVAHYQKLIYTITQLDPSQRETLEGFYRPFQEKYKDEASDLVGVTNSMHKDWNAIELHFIQQHWGSTSAGWGGIGGAAMKTTYSLIIENRSLKIIAVYYGSQLAYIVKMDEKLERFKQEGYTYLPGIDGVKSVLTTIYRHNRYMGEKRISKKLDSGQIVDIPEDVHKQYFKDVNKDKSVKLRILPKKKDYMQNDIKTFIIDQIEFLSKRFPDMSFEYGFDITSHQHLIDVKPNSAYKSKAYMQEEFNVICNFMNRFPNDEVLFISDDKYIKIENPIYIKKRIED